MIPESFKSPHSDEHAMISELLYIQPSPWYNCNGWLGVKHQLTYLYILPQLFATFHSSCFFFFFFFPIVSKFNMMKTPTLLVPVGLFWCFHSPPNSDMDPSIFNVRYVIFLHAYIHTGPWFIVSSKGLWHRIWLERSQGGCKAWHITVTHPFRLIVLESERSCCVPLTLLPLPANKFLYTLAHHLTAL